MFSGASPWEVILARCVYSLHPPFKYLIFRSLLWLIYPSPAFLNPLQTLLYRARPSHSILYLAVKPDVLQPSLGRHVLVVPLLLWEREF